MASLGIILCRLFLVASAFFLFRSRLGDGSCRSAAVAAAAYTPMVQVSRHSSSRHLGSSSRTRLLLATEKNNGDKNLEDSEGDMSDDLLERRLQKDWKATMVERDDTADTDLLGFTPSNFDDSQIPIPAFTAVLILLGSLYVTGYGFYVGLRGFPADDTGGLPRIF